MRGQTISFEKKNEIAKKFIEKVKPYDVQKPLKFDMRGYAKYLSDHKIPGNKVPEDVLKMFSKG